MCLLDLLFLLDSENKVNGVDLCSKSNSKSQNVAQESDLHCTGWLLQFDNLMRLSLNSFLRAVMSASISSPIVPLDVLQVDECGCVSEIIASDEWKHRLGELGLREGVNVRMVKTGEPCLLAVAGHRLSFRCDPSTMVLVQLTESTKSNDSGD